MPPDSRAADGDDGDPARQVWLKIRALAMSEDVVGAEHAFMRDVGLSAGPVRVLRGLLVGGAQPMWMLAERLGCDKSYVTSLVKPLVAGGLVTLEPDMSDGRVKVVTPTTKGLALAREAQTVYQTPPAALRALDAVVLRQIMSLLSGES